jgi:hypothetical protein
VRNKRKAPLVLAAQPAAAPSILPRAALEMVRAEAEGLPDERVRVVHTEPLIAAGKVRALGPRLRSLREQLAALPGFDLERFDRLDLYASAVMAAHTRVGTSRRRDLELSAIAKEGFALRANLLSDARALARRRLIEAGPLKRLHRPSGYTHLAFDLYVLAQVLRQAWPAIAGRTATTEADLSRADALAAAITERAERRNHTPEALAQARSLRDRVFTLLVDTYEDARVAIAYLRRAEHDAHKFAPPLRRNKRARKRKSVADAPTGSTLQASASPGPSATLTPSGGLVPATLERAS